MVLRWPLREAWMSAVIGSMLMESRISSMTSESDLVWSSP